MIEFLPIDMQNDIETLVKIAVENKPYKMILMPIYQRTSDGYITKRMGVQGSVNGIQVKIQNDTVTFSEEALNTLINEIKSLINGEVIDGC